MAEGDDGGCRDGRVDEPRLAVNPVPDGRRRVPYFTYGEAYIVLCVVHVYSTLAREVEADGAPK